MNAFLLSDFEQSLGSKIRRGIDIVSQPRAMAVRLFAFVRALPSSI
jgi:hypothetical protein